MHTNRDNFSEDTKNRAARRVGFLCSKPDCRCHTVGPSAESSRAVSNIGVAAHICAAAPGGKRYNPKMTPEERMSIDNCIWLCQTDARLIDTDEATYTVELLQHWKSEAEDYAAKAISDGNFLKNYYSGNGDNLTQLEELLKSMIRRGEFALMAKILTQYSYGLSEKYDECILRNRITWCVYCDRTELWTVVNQYSRLPDKSGVDDLLRLFLSFGMINEMRVLRAFSHETDLDMLVDLAISDGLDDFLIGKREPTECIEVYQVTKDAVDKYLLVLLCTKGIFGLQNRDGSEYKYAPCETYWTMLWDAYSMVTVVANGSVSVKCIATQFEQILKGIEVFDPSLQSLIWDMALCMVVPDKKLFEKWYHLCPEKVREADRVKRARLAYVVEHDFDSVNIDDLIAYCSAINDYYLAVQYCEKLNPSDECAFLDEHQYLYKKDSRFLYRRLIVHRSTLVIEPVALLEKYKDTYSEDFLFNCLVADFSPYSQTRQEALARLKQHNAGVTFFALYYYARILSRNSQWEDLSELSRRRLPAEMQHYIADSLAQSNEPGCLSRGIEIYESLIASGYTEENIHHNLGIGYNLLGRTEDAKREFKKEYDAYRSEDVLSKLLMLRYETNEFIDDAYLQEAKLVSSCRMQNIVGAHLAKMGQCEEARNYFLRSLLVDERENPSITGYWNMCRRIQHSEPTRIGNDTAFTITNGDEKMYFALHKQ